MEQAFNISKSDGQKLRELPVAALVLFGSRAQGIAKDGSDYDVGVLVSDPRVLKDRGRRNDLYNVLYDILSVCIGKLTDIDIVFLAEAPAELKAHVIKKGRLLYGDAIAFADFKAREMISYADFAPFRHIFQEAALARIAG